MNKLRSDSAWVRLTPEQRAKLESWLFAEHRGYRKILELVRSEFGMKPSMTSLAMYCQRVAEERRERREREELLEWFKAHDGEAGVLEKLRGAGDTLTTVRMIEMVMKSPDKINDFTSLCRAMTRSREAGLKEKSIALENKKLEWEMARHPENPPQNEGGVPLKSA